MNLQERQQQVEDMSGQNPLPGIPNAPPPEYRPSASHALMATMREPLAILDSRLRVVAASHAYARLFPANTSALPGRPFCEPRTPRWGALALQTLHDVMARDSIAQDVEIELELAEGGTRRMLLNARRTAEAQDGAIVVGLHDVTELREAERLKAEVAEQQAMLLQEAHHRIANSLQIIASILLLKARAVQSEETRMHLRDVHKRLILVAGVQRQLCSVGMLDEVEFGPYVAQLCQGIASSMTEGDDRIAILTSSSGGTIKSDDAVNFGLIITELVINAIKHGFPDGRRGFIEVAYAAEGPNWRLSVSDDGVGQPPSDGAHQGGLGTSIVEALARHLKATVEVATGDGGGSSTSIVHTERAAG
ncbi:MAG: histidine kinase dimerization/phosphoacceptor domain -containing protein [Rhizomicrobium sp.]